MKKGMSDAGAVAAIIAIVIVVLAAAYVLVFQPQQDRINSLEVQNECVLNTDCPAFSYCDRGVCLKQTQNTISQFAGESCDRNADCDGGLICGGGLFGFGKTCRTQGTSADSCNSDIECVSGLRCIARTCQVPTQDVLTANAAADIYSPTHHVFSQQVCGSGVPLVNDFGCWLKDVSFGYLQGII